MSRRTIADVVIPVVANMISLRQLGADTTEHEETMATLEICAQLAYTQICSWACREFHTQDTGFYIRENHPTGCVAELRLRNTPVVEILSVEVIVPDDVTQIYDGVDFWQRNHMLHGLTTSYAVEVVYTGGYASFENEPLLLEAITQQALANYHRRDLLGISNIIANAPGGSGGSIKVASNAGGVLTAVRDLLSGLEYFGDAVLLEEGVAS